MTSPCYDDIFRRNYVFDAEFGDSENYFLELDYYIMREAFTSRRKMPLDIGIRYCDDAGASEEIFRNLSAAEKALIASRNYIVLEENIDISTSEFGDICHITEVYGYAPEKTFTQYESVLANSYAWKKLTNMSISGWIFYDADTGYFKLSSSSAANMLSVEDELSVYYNYSSTLVNISGGVSVYRTNRICMDPMTVAEIDVLRGDVYANAASGTFVGYGAVSSIGVDVFRFWDMYPAGYLTINNIKMTKPGSCKIILRNTQKQAGQFTALARKDITFHLSTPQLATGYIPIERNGAISNMFSSTTTPTVDEHLANMKNSTLVRLEDDKIDPQLWHGLYKKTCTFVPAR